MVYTVLGGLAKSIVAWLKFQARPSVPGDFLTSRLIVPVLDISWLSGILSGDSDSTAGAGICEIPASGSGVPKGHRYMLIRALYSPIDANARFLSIATNLVDGGGVYFDEDAQVSQYPAKVRVVVSFGLPPVILRAGDKLVSVSTVSGHSLYCQYIDFLDEK